MDLKEGDTLGSDAWSHEGSREKLLPWVSLSWGLTEVTVLHLVIARMKLICALVGHSLLRQLSRCTRSLKLAIAARDASEPVRRRKGTKLMAPLPGPAASVWARLLILAPAPPDKLMSEPDLRRRGTRLTNPLAPLLTLIADKSELALLRLAVPAKAGSTLALLVPL